MPRGSIQENTVSSFVPCFFVPKLVILCNMLYLVSETNIKRMKLKTTLKDRIVVVGVKPLSLRSWRIYGDLYYNGGIKQVECRTNQRSFYVDWVGYEECTWKWIDGECSRLLSENLYRRIKRSVGTHKIKTK